MTIEDRSFLKLLACSPLTKRELQVLELIAQGKSQKQVAAELGISIHTVMRRLESLYKRLQIHKTAEAVHYALRKRLVPLKVFEENLEFYGLTRRETEVLKLIAEGNSNKKIASALSISTKTADNHRNNIYEKLGLKYAQVSQMVMAIHFAISKKLTRIKKFGKVAPKRRRKNRRR